MLMLGPGDDIKVVKTPKAFQALRHEWHALWSRANGQYHESFAACWHSWQCVAKPMGRSLRIITLRRGGRLIAVWPLVRSREFLWAVLRPLNSDSADYTSILLDPIHSTSGTAAAMWRAACEQCAPDVMMFGYIDQGSDLHRLAMEHDGLMVAEEAPYSVARLSLEADWESFVASIGMFMGKKPNMLRKRLERQGKVDLRILGPEDADENTRMITWMLAQKRGWAERTQKNGPWLHSENFSDYLVALANNPGDGDSKASARVMVLTLNNVPVAVNMVGMGKDSMLGLMAGFDRDYAKYGPGAITTEAWVRWALEQKLDLNLGVGSEPFKSYWSKGNVALTSRIQIAQSSWGRIAFAMRNGSKKLSEIRASMRRTSKADCAVSADLEPR